MYASRLFRIWKSARFPGLGPELRISATYSYEAREQRKINFGILLTVTHSDKELVLPISKSTKPVVIQPQPRSKHSTRGLTLPLEYVYNFSWADILPDLERMANSSGSGQDESLSASVDGDQDQGQDLSLVFFITAYLPYPTTITSSPESCNETELKEYILTKTPLPPPYLKHGSSMFHDEWYSDLIVRAGTEEFYVHRIILASTEAHPIQKLNSRITHYACALT
jgi:hypothetical protein